MKVIFDDKLKYEVKESFPSIKDEKYKYYNDFENLKEYFQTQKQRLLGLQRLEELKDNQDVDDYDFFNELLNYCKIKLSIEDKDEYLKEVMNGNYQIHILKTMIPDADYDVLKDNVNYSLIKAVFAIKDNVSLEDERIYTQEELALLHNKNQLRLLSTYSRYHKIDAITYSKLSRNYKSNNMLSLDFDDINKYNYLSILNSCPYLGEYIRKNIDFQMISDLLLNFEEQLSEVINNEVNTCNREIERYHDRLAKIKILSNYNK